MISRKFFLCGKLCFTSENYQELLINIIIIQELLAKRKLAFYKLDLRSNSMYAEDTYFSKDVCFHLF